MSNESLKPNKKLIEVAFPLQVINSACAAEKNNPFLKSHPRSIHTWWARRPLAACRAVLFASLIDDPGNFMDEKKIIRNLIIKFILF